jgi:hypothetical protein
VPLSAKLVVFEIINVYFSGFYTVAPCTTNSYLKKSLKGIVPRDDVLTVTIVG